MSAQEPEDGGRDLPPPPFLSKCYEIVDDPSTDATVSWGASGDTFIVWDSPSFAREIFPKYFKHSNFSSFLRQLNTYGFRKVDPDRWEFANEGFRKGQKDLLKSIARRKHAQSQTQQKPPPVESPAPARACVEVGKFGVEEEIERLKRDKNVLTQELVKLRLHHQSTDLLLKDLWCRVKVMEQHQQQMLSFFVMAMQRPGFFAQLLQQNEHLLMGVSKKRRLPVLEEGAEDVSPPSEGQIVKYEPPKRDDSKHAILQVSESEASQAPVLSSDGTSDWFDDVDLATLGFDMSLPVEVERLDLEADGALVFLELYNEELEQLLSNTSHSEVDEGSRPDVQDSFNKTLQVEADTRETEFETRTTQSVDQLTEQMGLLASKTSR